MPEGIEEQGRCATINFLDAVTLTGDFADNTSEAYQVSPFAQLEFIFDYTMNGSETGNKAIAKILFSEDGTNYHEYSISQEGTPSSKVVESTLHARRFVVEGTAGVKESRWYAVPTSAKWVKVAAMESGIASNGGVFTAKARVSNDLEIRK